MRVGDRVIRNYVGGASDPHVMYGWIVGWNEQRGFEVRWDGITIQHTAYYGENELLPVEVVTVEGTLQYYSGISRPEGYYVKGEPLSRLFNERDEQVVRITIERVKREG